MQYLLALFPGDLYCNQSGPADVYYTETVRELKKPYERRKRGQVSMKSRIKCVWGIGFMLLILLELPSYANGTKIVMPPAPVSGTIEKPEAIVIQALGSLKLKPIRLERSFMNEIMEPVDKEEFKEKIQYTMKRTS